MQRVRIGLTGLAFVFLLVLLGAVFSRWSTEEPAANNMANIANNTAEPNEPLAELGVAPGGAPPPKPATTTMPATTSSPVPREPLAEMGVAPGGSRPASAATQPTRTAAAQTGAGVAH